MLFQESLMKQSSTRRVLPCQAWPQNSAVSLEQSWSSIESMWMRKLKKHGYQNYQATCEVAVHPQSWWGVIIHTRHPETTRKVTFKKKRFLSGSRTYNFCSGPEILVSVFFGPEILVSVFWDPECWVLNHPDLKESSSCLAYSLWWCGLRLWRCGGLLFFCCCGRSMIECLVFGAIFWWDLRLMD